MMPQWKDFVKYAALGQGPAKDTATKTPSASTRPTFRRVGGSPDSKPPVKQKANTKMTANEIATLEKARMYNEIRRLKYMELNKRFPLGKVPKSESRKAFYVSPEDIQNYRKSQSGVK